MNLRQLGWKRITLALGALLTILASFVFTNSVARDIAEREEQNMHIWAEATRLMLNEDYNELAFNIIEQNNSIPIVVVDDRGQVTAYRNFDPPKRDSDQYFRRAIARIRQKRPPLIINISPTDRQYIYYDDSLILKSLSVFPIVQVILIILFAGLLVWIFRSERKSEENKVWVGLSKETAHQLGTPISSLAAWQEILKSTESHEIADEMERDIVRLKSIVDRFSKIGSTPRLTPADITAVVASAVEYMRSRTSGRVSYTVDNQAGTVIVPLCAPLMQWVVENLCKNAVDAMNGEGSIRVTMQTERHRFVMELSDSGRGIDKRNFRRVFSPGYTTKSRGWGLGLSLAKRIVEEYHRGRIYVKQSEIGVGTTFRIELKTNQ